MTKVSLAVTEGSLPRAAADNVLSLVAAVHAADGVAPLSEDALYTVTSGGKGVKHFSLTLPDGTLIGYAHLVAAEPDAPDGDLGGELLIDPSYRRRGFGSALATELVNSAAGHGVRVWAHGDLPAAAALKRYYENAAYDARVKVASVDPAAEPWADSMEDAYLTAFSAEEVVVGMRLTPSFRRLWSTDGIHNYFWKLRPGREGR